MGVWSEVTQQELGRVHGRIGVAMESLMAAHTAAKRLVDRDARNPNFGPRILAILELTESLHGDMAEVIGPVEPHRGLRTPPVCNDPSCPVHGKSVFGQELRDKYYVCSVAAYNAVKDSE